VNDLPKIFVAIPSYRDPECQYTVRDLFLKAAHPERISVGICWQLDPEHDQDCCQVPPPYPEQVRQIHVHASASKGGCWARGQALSLLQNEDYVLQIDAHMRFAAGWDELMLDNLRRCPSPKAMLSTMPPAYLPPEELQDCTGGLPITYVNKIAGPKDLQPVWLGGWIRGVKQLPPGPVPTPFAVGNFLFAPSAIFKEVPFDPHIYFFGDELTFSARSWTHGWDIYQPDCLVIYHYWRSKKRSSDTEGFYKSVNPAALLARERVWHVMEVEEAKDPLALVDIEKYGMGKVRPLAHFWEFADVNLKAGTIGPKAARGTWTPYRP
jgi:hypothetical protein